MIGINSQIETGSSGDGSVGIGFAIPINTALAVIPQIEKTGKVSQGFLGITEITVDPALAPLHLHSSYGALVQTVQSPSPAAAAGLRAGNLPGHAGGRRHAGLRWRRHHRLTRRAPDRRRLGAREHDPRRPPGPGRARSASSAASKHLTISVRLGEASRRAAGLRLSSSAMGGPYALWAPAYACACVSHRRLARPPRRDPLGCWHASARVKICGVTRLDDAALAAELGAWAVGHGLLPGLAAPLRARRGRAIGAALRRRVELCRRVRQRPARRDRRASAERVGLTLVQLHGDEGPAFCAEVARRTGARTIKAAPVRGLFTLRDLERFHTDFHLLDGHAPGCAAAPASASTGRCWRSAARSVPLIVGGGLDAEQRRARRSPPTHPYAVDVASGVEAAPGDQGSRSGMRAFFDGGARPVAGMSARRAPLRPLRRPVRARDADAGARRARGGVGRGLGRRRTSAPSWRCCCATSPAARRRCIEARRLSERAGRPIWLKREDLNHTGSHKLNNALGQALLAKRMGKPRIIAETGAGQHGVAAATACALLGLECVVYMGEEDIRRQQPNVQRMRAARRPRAAGRRRRAHAQGGDLGGDPRLGRERRARPTTSSAARSARRPTRRSCASSSARSATRRARSCSSAPGACPSRVIACVGGGSNSIGIFAAFIDDAGVELIGVEAAGDGHRDRPPRRAADRRRPRRACCTARSRRCSPTRTGRSSRPTRSRPASTTRAPAPSTPSCATAAAPATSPSTDDEALDAFGELARLEGIIPALESAHALAWALANPGGELDLICLSGRGDKDLAEVLALRPLR